ncbi:isochorismate synthase [Agromyces sp. MMS17-SY077]|uniref:isochorismate synthase n=2 Tax=Agromyces seonyuensis TaxID=2662446 RepID=A0A6I4P114_9MICO|nr:chorismate-binding protein [Agromyces seonyuensis]MWC00237.1 isochorismate synthase [Agromyces seonyuensis]
MRRGEGLIGLGEAVRIETGGPGRIVDAARAWTSLVAAADVDDRVGLPGTGLVAFGTFAFADDSAATSVLVVPELVLGRRDGRAWATTIRFADTDEPDDAPFELPEPAPKRLVPDVGFEPDGLAPDDYEAAVARAVERIDAGEFEKVVLARRIVGRLDDGAGLRAMLDLLARRYPDTWTFAVDGLVGASPETLVRVDTGTVSARVLAGTASRGADETDDRARAAALAASPKDRAEHALAVASAVDTLAPHTARLDASPEPFTLQLPNLWHLATDLKGTLGDGSSSLALVEAMHPTAAVAGTPRDAATAAIAELEGFDRERYAGPVGWVDAAGDGEWAIALRCAQVADDGRVTAWAGCGIVHDSVPASELAETGMKFRPITEAFGAPPPSAS